MIKGVRAVSELTRVPGIVIILSQNGWMNEALTKDWVCRVWGPAQLSEAALSVGCLQVPLVVQRSKKSDEKNQHRSFHHPRWTH